MNERLHDGCGCCAMRLRLRLQLRLRFRTSKFCSMLSFAVSSAALFTSTMSARVRNSLESFSTSRGHVAENMSVCRSGPADGYVIVTCRVRGHVAENMSVCRSGPADGYVIVTCRLRGHVAENMSVCRSGPTDGYVAVTRRVRPVTDGYVTSP